MGPPVIRESERSWQGRVLERARQGRWRAYHTRYSIGSQAGFPDLVLVKPGRLIFAELKSDKGSLSPKQLEWVTLLLEAGQEVHVWRPQDEPMVTRILMGIEP